MPNSETTVQSIRNTMLSLKNIHKEYDKDDGDGSLSSHVILNNLNLDIKQGEFVTIVGPSGCGKSTLLNLVAGLDAFYTGEILIDNKPIHKTPFTDRVVVFQEGALFPWLTVYKNIEFGLKISKIPKTERRESVMRHIDMVQLTNFSNAFIHQLSGGMKQRVAIARALALNPKILLMDEPFAALDVHTRRMLYNQLLNIHQKTNKTILFVTHNINEAVALGDRVIVMSPKLANIRKEFIVDIPRPRRIDHPLVDSITKEIMTESEDLFHSPASNASANPGDEAKEVQEHSFANPIATQ
jgi:NitT/TauT family transport system ATP-binding protein